MSDRGIPRSYRTMEGFGVHPFRLVNGAGETSLVKFHGKPAAGVRSLLWEEAQLASGADPDYHRRDLAEGIEAGVRLVFSWASRSSPMTAPIPSAASTCSILRSSFPRSWSRSS